MWATPWSNLIYIHVEIKNVYFSVCTAMWITQPKKMKENKNSIFFEFGWIDKSVFTWFVLWNLIHV